MTQGKEYPWAKRFVEIALRALRRVHFDYQLWSIGQDWTSELDPSAYNTGAGIEYADEVTVCAAITQEFVHSSLTSGAYTKGDVSQRVGPGQRYYAIYREVPYPGGLAGRVDIAIDRVDPPSNKAIGAPVFIEAKRAAIVSTKLAEGSLAPPRLQLTAIKADIGALRATHALPPTIRVLTHILVWGVHPQSVPGGTPAEMLRALGDSDVALLSERWMPLRWNSRNPTPSPDQFLWVALFEVGPLPPKDPVIDSDLRPRVLST